MFAVTVDVDIKNVVAATGIAPSKMRRVAANALTGTAKAIKFTHGPAGMEKVLDRPTKFTKRGWRWKRAYPSQENPFSVVYFAKKQDWYLELPVTGGATGEQLPIPAKESPRTREGNLPRRATTTGKTFFIPMTKGRVYGMTLRRVGKSGGLTKTGRKSKRKSKVKMIALWSTTRTYTKGTFPMFKVVKKGASKSYNQEFRKAFRRVFP